MNFSIVLIYLFIFILEFELIEYWLHLIVPRKEKERDWTHRNRKLTDKLWIDASRLFRIFSIRFFSLLFNLIDWRNWWSSCKTLKIFPWSKFSFGFSLISSIKLLTVCKHLNGAFGKSLHNWRAWSIKWSIWWTKMNKRSNC